MPELIHNFNHNRLYSWAIACLGAVNVSREHAETVARSLVQTSLWGIDSHGIARLTHYLSRIQAGSIEPNPKMEIIETGPCTATMNGGHGLGIVICHKAMGKAIELAKQNGVGLVGISESTHCGAIGLYSRQAAIEGLIGVAFTHSDALVVPFGGKERFLGTNPISIAFPRTGKEPLCLDMATSAIPWNRVMNARRENDTLPEGVAMDRTGSLTRDPQEATSLFPLGGEDFGYKGYGLALMIDILCGPLNGMPFGPNIPVMYGDLRERRHLGSLMIAIDPNRFVGGAHLSENVLLITELLKNQTGTVLFPGEPEYIRETERKSQGIPVDQELLKDMNDWSQRLNLPLIEDMTAL
jgi:ureidoglycolate dehydrogenase (NAD+)